MGFLGKAEWYAVGFDVHGITVGTSWGNRVEMLPDAVDNPRLTACCYELARWFSIKKAAPKSGF
jgi:hypothetical protein